MTDNREYNLWRENFLGVFRQISTDEDFKKLASFYPYNDYNDNKCKQRKNNLPIKTGIAVIFNIIRIDIC